MRTNGFRLPTEKEQEYLPRDGGAQDGEYAFGDDEKQRKGRAWYGENSGGKTHPVGEKLPIIINGQLFYDLLGRKNVWDWGEDKPNEADRDIRGGVSFRLVRTPP